MGWDPKKAAWEEGFAHLQVRRARGPRAGPARLGASRDFRLGQWVACPARHARPPNRRSTTRGPPPSETPRYGLGIRNETAAWEDGFEHLVRFVSARATRRVPRAWCENGYRLGQWVIVQRARPENPRPEQKPGSDKLHRCGRGASGMSGGSRALHISPGSLSARDTL